MSRRLVAKRWPRCRCSVTTVKNGKGTFVISNRMTVPNLMGRYSPKSLNQVRRFLEVPAARLAALNRTDEDLGRRAEIIARLEDSEVHGRAQHVGRVVSSGHCKG